MSNNLLDLDAWRAALVKLQSASNDNSTGFTLKELMDKLGKGASATRTELKALINNGDWQCLGRKRQYGISGVMHYTPTYGPVNAKLKKKSR